jgi:hypothetical protein
VTILGGAPRIAFLSLLAALTACLAVLPGPARAAATPPLALGVNIANAPDQLAPLQQYASQAGREPAIVMWYQQWSEPLYYSDQETNTKAIGAIPLITWDPDYNGAGIPLSQIVAGSYDKVIVAAAQAAKAWGRPMYIRLAHEMNISTSLYGPGHNGNTAAEFVAAWKHVVTIFRQQGATNVEWVWSPNVYCGGQCPFSAYYPGDAWVDWVALDGYNYSTVDGVPWMTFAQVIGPSYSILSSLSSRPMMISETASAEAGGSKAQWIAQMFSSIASSYPRIHAVVWFDRVKETDWTIDSSASTLAAWQTAVATPANEGTATTLETEYPFSSSVTSASATQAPAVTGQTSSQTTSQTTSQTAVHTTGSSPAHATPVASRGTTPIASNAHARLTQRDGAKKRTRAERSHRKRARHRAAKAHRHALSGHRAIRHKH